EAGHRPVLRLYLPGEEGDRLDHREGQGTVPPGRQPAPGSTAAPAQRRHARLVQPLPPRGVQRRLRLPARLRLAPGLRLAAPQTPPEHLEGPAPQVPRRRLVAPRREDGPVQPGGGTHHALPLPGHGHPLPVATGRSRPEVTGLAESRMRCQAARPVRERGLEKRAGRKASTALRADLTRSSRPTTRCATPCSAGTCSAPATGPA